MSKIFAAIILACFLFGCSDAEIDYNYSDNKTTYSFINNPYELVFSKEETLSYNFAFDKDALTLLGYDSSMIDSDYSVDFNPIACANALDKGLACVMSVTYKLTPFACTDKNKKYIVLKFRFLDDMSSGMIKDQILSVGCK